MTVRVSADRGVAGNPERGREVAGAVRPAGGNTRLVGAVIHGNVRVSREAGAAYGDIGAAPAAIRVQSDRWFGNRQRYFSDPAVGIRYLDILAAVSHSARDFEADHHPPAGEDVRSSITTVPVAQCRLCYVHQL